MDDRAKVGLVGCSKRKAAGPRRACELYCSPLFRKAAGYCRRRYDAWFVLSALHGLVEPDRVIAPYDHTLADKTREEKRRWAEGVVAELERRGLSGARFHLHAGADYASGLSGLLDCETPLAGLGVGERLAWYAREEKAAMKETTLKVPALEVRQRGRVLYSFAVEGKLLCRFAAVSRVGRDGGGAVTGYQRPEVLAHVAQISAYLRSDGAILPNAVVVAFDRPAEFDGNTSGGGASRAGALTIQLADEEERKPAWVVDGQQRVAALRDTGLDGFPVFVTAFVARSLAEQREQFVLVNSTKPLPAGLVHELLPCTDAPLPQRLARRRFPALLLDRLNRDADSPLRGRVRTPTCPDGVIKDASILSMIGNSLSDGVIYLFRGGEGGPDVEAMLRVLKDFWSAVAAVFPEAWSRPPRLSRLTHGAGVVALGLVMDAVADYHRAEGVPARSLFVEELARLSPHCHWTPESGDWRLDGLRRRWNEIQNTPRDVRLLADLLLKAYRRLVRTPS